VREAQKQIERTTRQLELAADLEARLQLALEAPSGQGAPLPPSPERRLAEVEATWALLQAELRAANILNRSGSRHDPSPCKPAAINPEAARALEDHLAELADIEAGEAALAATARQLVRRDLARGPGSASRARNVGPQLQRVRDVPSHVDNEEVDGLVRWAQEESVAIVQDAQRRAAELEPDATASSEPEELARLLLSYFELQETLVNLLSQIAR
jgi:hypothetical protein